jgi:hypothetical protein
MLTDFGKLFIILGAVLLIIGLILTFLPGLRIGRLPGDIVIRRGNWGIYIPIVTSLVLSLVLTLVFWVISSWRR